MQRVATSCGESLRVCRICFSADGKLYLMTAHRMLSQAYEAVTGLLVEGAVELPAYLCSECALQLLRCARFRTRTLRAH